MKQNLWIPAFAGTTYGLLVTVFSISAAQTPRKKLILSLHEMEQVRRCNYRLTKELTGRIPTPLIHELIIVGVNPERIRLEEAFDDKKERFATAWEELNRIIKED